MFRRMAPSGNSLYGKISPDSNDDIGLHSLHREKLTGRHLLESRSMEDIVDSLHGVLKRRLVAYVADVELDLVCNLGHRSLIEVTHVVLLLLVAREDTDLTDIRTEKTVQNCVTEATGSTGDHQNFVFKNAHDIYFLVYSLFSPLRPHRIRQEVLVGEADAVFEFGLVGPAEGGGLGDIEELARCAVRTGGVPLDLAFVADDLGDELGESLDREFLAGTGIDGLVAGVVVHQEDAEIGEVIHVEKLAQRASVSPAGYFLQARDLGLVEAADKGRKDVAVLRVIIVVRTVEVRRHH